MRYTYRIGAFLLSSALLSACGGGSGGSAMMPNQNALNANELGNVDGSAIDNASTSAPATLPRNLPVPISRGVIGSIEQIQVMVGRWLPMPLTLK